MLNAENGKMVTSLAAIGSDDIFYDASKMRVYVLGNPTQTDAREVGNGFMEVFQQSDSDHYAEIASYPTCPGAWTGLFVPEWGNSLLPHVAGGEKSGEILVYKTKYGVAR